MKRRQFLKISSALFASAAAPGLSWENSPVLAAPEERVVPSICELCFWRCGIQVQVKEGRVAQITGHPKHPLSNGKLCPRGVGGTGLLYDPDRLRQPLIREEVDGKQQFRPATWDEALDLIAERLGYLTAFYGTESVAMFNHGFGASFFKTLFKAYGIHTFSAPSYAQCRGPRQEAFKLTYGHGLGSPEALDVAHSKCLVLLGTHLGENMHNTAVQDFTEAVARGCHLIVVDPRFSTAAGKAREWLPIKPGTDLALLLSWIRTLIEEELYDRDFVEVNTVGLEEVRVAVAHATPEWAAAQTGIRAERILATARDLGRYRNEALVHPGRRVVWYGDDTQRERAIAILNALLGNYRHPGGLLRFSGFSVPSVKFPEEKNAFASFSSRFPLASAPPANELVEQTVSGDPYPIKAWFVYGTNLIHALGDQARTLQAIEALDLLVAIDVLPMEITGYADVVLPECTYLERYDDLDTRSYRTPYVALRQPVVKPMYDSLPGHEIARRLAGKLGMPDLFPDDMEAYLDGRLQQVGLSLQQLQVEGVVSQPEPEDLYRQPAEPLRFRTPSGKIELASAQLAQAGFDAVPRYTPPPAAPPGYFRLLHGRAPMHTFGRTANNRMLGELMPENELWVNAVTGKDVGLKSGEYVYLVNQDGVRSRTPIKVRLTERIRPEAVYMAHGFGHTDPRLKFAAGKGASDADLITHLSLDPIMGGTGMNNNFVTFTRSAES